jgi:hypothetical protein
MPTSADNPPTFPQRRTWSGATHHLFFATVSLVGGLAGLGAAAMVGVLTRWEHPDLMTPFEFLARLAAILPAPRLALRV